jgi:phosphoenolpyruvate carboxylase
MLQCMNALDTPDKHARLAEDIRLLGRILGETIRSLEGEPAFALIEEIRGYPKPPAPDRRPEDYGGVAIPFQLMMGDRMLSLFGTTTVFGTPVDITLSELTLETFFPADAATGEALRAAHEARMAGG